MSENFEEIEIMRAEREHLDLAKDILVTNHLTVLGIEDQFLNFFVLYVNGQIIGIVGLEIYNTSGLLRSLAILPEYQKKGLGITLVQQIIEYAQEKKLKTVYLLTETAKSFFEKQGFSVVDRKEAPPEIQNSKEFSSACPVNATFMKRII